MQVARPSGTIGTMNPYFIGSGVLLEAGERATTAPATLHAQTDAALAAIRCAAVDFEGGSQRELHRILLVAAGWTGSAFDRAVMAPLRLAATASLADVLAAHAGVGDGVVHLFARWLPDPELVEELHLRGVALVSHPLEAIRRAALITGTRVRMRLAIPAAA